MIENKMEEKIDKIKLLNKIPFFFQNSFKQKKFGYLVDLILQRNLIELKNFWQENNKSWIELCFYISHVLNRKEIGEEMKDLIGIETDLLLLSCSCGNLKLVKYCLSKGASLSSSSLDYAFFSGNIELIEFIFSQIQDSRLNHSIDLNPYYMNKTSIEWLISKGSCFFLKNIYFNFKTGANINWESTFFHLDEKELIYYILSKTDKMQWDDLMRTSCELGYEDLFELSIQKGANDFNFSLWFIFINKIFNFFFNFFIYYKRIACRSENISFFHKIISKGEEILGKKAFKWNDLMCYASKLGKIKFVEIIFQYCNKK